MKMKNIIKAVKKEPIYFNGTVQEKDDYIYLYTSHGIIHYDDRFECSFEVYKDKVKVRLQSIQESGSNCVDYREYKRTLNETYLYNDKKELAKIINYLSNSLTMKDHRSGHGGFRRIDAIENLRRCII